MDALRSEVRLHMMEIKDLLCAVYTENGIKVPTPLLQIPDTHLDSVDTTSTTAPSAISSVSSASLNFDRMTMDSPVLESMGPPIAGPSGLRRDRPQTRGMLLRTPCVVSDFANIWRGNSPASVPNSRSQSKQRSGPSSKAASAAGSCQPSRTRNQ